MSLEPRTPGHIWPGWGRGGSKNSLADVWQHKFRFWPAFSSSCVRENPIPPHGGTLPLPTFTWTLAQASALQCPGVVSLLSLWMLWLSRSVVMALFPLFPFHSWVQPSRRALCAPNAPLSPHPPLTCLLVMFWWWKVALCCPKWQLIDLFNSSLSLWVLTLLAGFVGGTRYSSISSCQIGKHHTSSEDTDMYGSSVRPRAGLPSAGCRAETPERHKE